MRTIFTFRIHVTSICQFTCRCIRVFCFIGHERTLYLIGQPCQMEQISAILPSDAELQLEKHDQNMGITYNLPLGTVQVPVPAEARRIRVIHLACEIFDNFRCAFQAIRTPWLWVPVSGDQKNDRRRHRPQGCPSCRETSSEEWTLHGRAWLGCCHHYQLGTRPTCFRSIPSCGQRSNLLTCEECGAHLAT
jgi:hypothetical protein